ncbi:hypothetical protein GHT09_009570 [Marmota monax]|uniref:Uncharacterized protein n=1 Tax=Marmota monax TaxID=9995 RepID=A0A834UK57_MARMO|nr:hypothetical protein GHT09_009570 [Marmota monax]
MAGHLRWLAKTTSSRLSEGSLKLPRRSSGCRVVDLRVHNRCAPTGRLGGVQGSTGREGPAAGRADWTSALPLPELPVVHVAARKAPPRRCRGGKCACSCSSCSSRTPDTFKPPRGGGI